MRELRFVEKKREKIMKASACCCGVAVLAAMSLTTVAPAGLIPTTFQVDAAGDWIEDGNNFRIDAGVTAQDPDFDFEFFEALFVVEELGNPDMFTESFVLGNEVDTLTAWSPATSSGKTLKEA